MEREIGKRISPPRNPSSGWIAIKKSKSGFHGFPFYRSNGKSEKRFAKPLLIMRAQARPLILRTVFQILFRISQSNGKKEIQKQISQRWNLFSDFVFDCRSEIRFFKSNPDFLIEHILTRVIFFVAKLIFNWFPLRMLVSHSGMTTISDSLMSLLNLNGRVLRIS